VCYNIIKGGDIVNIKKMKEHISYVISEIIAEKKDCKDYMENDTLMSEYDNTVKEYRIIADYINLFAESDEEKELVKLLKSINYVRCFGTTPEAYEKEMQDFYLNDDSGGIR
jgi:hypothetical protein